MGEFVGRMLPITISYGTGKPIVSFEVEKDHQSLFQMYEELKTAERLTIKVGKFSKKRSLDANAYCWVLIGKLAEKLNVPRTEIYRSAVKEIGASDTVCVQDKAVGSLCDAWSRNGIGWVTDTFPSKIAGCTNVILYYGSSTYDVPTMCRLIDIIVQDCKAVGIETRSEEEINSLLGAWGR